jgi:beta-lactamase regulating signal transducer with metallopeptidase domain
MWWLPSGELIEAWMQVMSRASVYGGLAIASAWGVCRFLPRMSPTVRSWIWRLVYLKLILLLLWPSPIRLPLLPNPDVRIEQAEPSSRVGSAAAQISTASEIFGREKQSRPEPAARMSLGFSTVALLLVWLVGIFFVLIRTIRNTLATQRTVRESHSMTDRMLREECEALSQSLRLRKRPQLLSHENISSPQVVGVLSPVVIFPASFVDQFSRQEVRLVLAHELAHVRRHDLFWGWVRRGVNGLLFFHPLAWLAHEEATLAEEIACDESALRGVKAEISDYAGTLLKVTEQSLLMPRGQAVLQGSGMSRAYRVTASRLQALPNVRSFCSRVARWRRWRATLVGCLTVAVLLPLGQMTVFRSSGIKQIDTRYPVLGYKVSRGRNHTLAVSREICRFAGLKLSRATEDPGLDLAQLNQPGTSRGQSSFSARMSVTNSTIPGTRLPGRVASWLRTIGLKPQLDTANYSSTISVADDSYAFIVRFAHDQRDEDLAAFLVDEQGERIPLSPQRSELFSQSGEYVKFWVLSPPPITRAKFNLLLRLPAEGKDVALLRLGEL